MSLQHDVKNLELDELKDSSMSGVPMFSKNIDLVKNVKVKLTAMLGNAEITVDELFNLQTGSVVKLEQETTTPILIELEGNVVAKGMLVAVDDNFGIKITEIKTT